MAGSMPVHGIGSACFILQHGDTEVILKVHNCLLCHGEDNYNLLSVSQVLRTRKSAVIFSASADESRLELCQGIYVQHLGIEMSHFSDSKCDISKVPLRSHLRK